MSWWWRARRRSYRRVRDPRQPEAGDWVELEGFVRCEHPLHDPVEGRPAVALELRMWPPPTTVGVDGTMALGARAFEVVVNQAVDFVLECDGQPVRIGMARGQDAAARYAELVARHGVALRAEVTRVEPGARARVLGRVQEGFRGRIRSPHRREPWVMEVQADRLIPLALPERAR